MIFIIDHLKCANVSFIPRVHIVIAKNASWCTGLPKSLNNMERIRNNETSFFPNKENCLLNAFVKNVLITTPI